MSMKFIDFYECVFFKDFCEVYRLLCSAMLCYAMFCYAVLRYVMLCYATLCYTSMLCHDMYRTRFALVSGLDDHAYDVMLCYVLLCCAM